MATLIALLRGVNVGNNILRMERLRECCLELGMRNPRTYLQSGNIVFEGEGGVTKWARAIERRLAGETRLPITVVIRTAPEFVRMAEENPFLKERGIDETKLHATLLATIPTKTASRALAALDCGCDRFLRSGRDIYLHCPNGYGRSKLSNNAFEKVLRVRATTRNWNTVKNLLEIARV